MYILYHKVILVSNRLNDVLHKSLKLTMVFEYCDQDLKKYFDTCRGRVDKKTVQVYHVTVVLFYTIAILNNKNSYVAA